MRNVLLDAILFALFVAELSFRYLPKILHEILGVALAAAIIWHVTINRRRLMSSLKNLTPRKIFISTLNFSLIICAVVILVTGVCLSNYLFTDIVSFVIRRNVMIYQLHIAMPYVMLILIGVHIGLDWREFFNRLLQIIGARELYQRRKIFFQAVAIILSIVGVVGLFMNRVGDRILMKHIFATPATELNAALFALLLIGDVALFATITFFLEEKIFRRGRD